MSADMFGNDPAMTDDEMLKAGLIDEAGELTRAGAWLITRGVRQAGGPVPDRYVARFPIGGDDGAQRGAMVVYPPSSKTPGFVVRREWDIVTDGQRAYIEQDPFETVGEALTVALDRAGLYDDVAARIALHAAQTAALVADTQRFVGEPGEWVPIDASWQEHRGDEAAAREAGYFDDDRAFVVGQRYRVTYQGATQRVPRVGVMTYLGPNSTRGTDWSLRPHAGTIWIDDDELISAVRTDAPVTMPEPA